MPGLGADLPEFKPGCGSRTQDPGMAEKLALKFDAGKGTARAVHIDENEDIAEACFERGWTDGLPVIPPTPIRVARMLAATDRKAEELIGKIPPDYAPCTIE